MNTPEIAEILTTRIKAVEENNKLLEMRMVAAIQTIQQLRHEISVGKIERTRDNVKKSEHIVAAIRDEKEIVVPPELAITPTKAKPGRKRSGGGNRAARIVAKRWALWKIQYESGYTTHQIARAWKCNRTSVEYARDNDFLARMPRK